MATIPLSQGFVTQVDDADAERFGNLSWWVFRCGSTGSAKKYLYAVGRRPGSRRVLFLHREIMGSPPQLLVDHANGDTLDNRKQNLRLCDKRMNMQNSAPPRRGKFKGVRMLKDRFHARIIVCGKYLHLGTFETALDAALAYDKAAVKYFGKFARPNFATCDGGEAG